MTSIAFTVVGRAGPQGSKTRTASGFMRESSKFVAPWRKQVVAAAQAAMAEHPGFETILSPVL